MRVLLTCGQLTRLSCVRLDPHPDDSALFAGRVVRADGISTVFVHLASTRICRFLLPLLVLLAATVQAADDELPQSVANILAAHGMLADGFSVFVQDTAKDTPLLAVNADAARNPASTIKLLTTFLALDELKPNYRWRSEAYLGGSLQDGRLDGDLYLKGYGDPHLVIERYWLFLSQLRRNGLQHIGGDLVIDNTWFDMQPGSTGTFDGQPRRSYNVVPDALLVNLQTVSFMFSPNPLADRVDIVAEPRPVNFEIVNRLRLTDAGCGGFQRGIAATFDNTSAPRRVTFSGKYSRHCGRYRMSRSVLDAPAYAYGVFRGLWEEAGASLDGELRVEPVPDDVEPFHVFESLSLGEIIRLINKWSNNVMARHLLVTLGIERYGSPGTVAAGRRAAVEILGERGLDFPELRIDNGAGLSRDTRISARHLGELLLMADDSDFRAEFISSLPLSGMDGTMRGRFREPEMAGRMHVKTGRLDHVFAAAGFVRSQSGREYVVVAIQNETDAHRGPGEEAQSALLRWVYRQ
jgi:D-alanyl-D-alanine carboxypeptidase/D-alanyl-D-alanine-endopeptidase (penicillin-binding protein 4)